MKTICFIVLALFTFAATNTLAAISYKPNKYIIFEHIGITDKPINTVIIAQEQSRLPGTLNSIYFKYFINNTLYTKSELIVLNAKKGKQTYEFGNFKILIVNGNKKTVCFIAREDAVNLFNSLHAFYQKEKLKTELPLMIDELKTRIYY